MGTWEDLNSYVSGSADQAGLVQDCWNQSVVLVDRLVGTADVPAEIVNLAYVRCGAELFHARKAPNGVAQFADLQGVGIRIARDPLTPVYPLLTGWVVLF